MKTHLTGVLTLALVAALAMSPPARAQEDTGHGIKVNGRWTIEVRNPDGRLASRHQFNNSLVVDGGSGSGALVGLLGRFFRGIHRWEIQLTGPSGQPNGPCGFLNPCRILERLEGGAPGMGELSVTLSNGLDNLVLSGAIRATTAVPIASVLTVVSLCFDGACTQTSIPRSFTFHELATPINVAPNQLIEVTVVLSFS